AWRASGAIEAVKRRGRRRPVGAVGGVAAGKLVGTPGGRRVKGSTIGTGRLGWRNDCRCASTVCRILRDVEIMSELERRSHGFGSSPHRTMAIRNHHRLPLLDGAA